MNHSPVSQTVAALDGVLTYRRDGEQAQLIVSYRDPPQEQSLTAPLGTDQVGDVIDSMRRRATDQMEDILLGLWYQLRDKLPNEGLTDDFVDPKFGPFTPLPDVSILGGVLRVVPDRFLATVTLSSVAGLSDRHVAEMLFRAVLRERSDQLYCLYEEARRQLLLRLGRFPQARNSVTE